MSNKIGMRVFYGTLICAALFSVHSHAVRILPGEWSPGPLLGYGYNSAKHEIIAGSCVKASETTVGQSIGDIKYTSEATIEQIAGSFSGSAAMSLSVPFVKASGSMKYASENASTDQRMNWFFEFHATPKSLTLDGRTLKLSAFGEETRLAGADQISVRCGDEYVSQIDFGASLIATMSIEFSSKEDKNEFESAAAVGVNFGVGSVEVSASLDSMAKRMGSRTIVKVEAHQKGGNPGELSAIIDAGVVDCNLNEMKKCKKIFENILEYAKTNFRKQLSDVHNYSVVRYYTMPYAESQAYKLVPEEGFPILDEMVAKKRKDIQEAYEEQSLANNRASYITKKLKHFTPPEQLEKVKNIAKHSWDNMLTLTQAMNFCLKNPNRECLSHKANLVAYDAADLEVKVAEQVDPNSLLGKLFKAVKEDDQDAAYNEVIKCGGAAHMNGCDPQGYSPVHRAIEGGKYNLLELFIARDPKKGHSTESVVHLACDDAYQYTPLCLAAKGGGTEHLKCIDLLCKSGAGLDCRTNLGYAPLQVAVSCNQFDTMHDLIEKGANKNVQNVHKQTLLHIAAMNGNNKITKHLLDKGLSVSAIDDRGLTPLHWAAREGQLEVVKTLLKYKADPMAKDSQGRTALHWGVKYEGVAKELIHSYDLSLNSRTLRHTEMVMDVAFNRDGSTLASASKDKTIKVWNAQTGALIHTLSGHLRCVNSVAFSRDGSILVSASGDRTIKVWNVQTGALIHTLSGHTEDVNSVAFSCDGSTLASASFDKTIKVWNAQTGSLIRTLSGHTEDVNSVAFSRKGSMLASTSDDKTIKVWNAQTGALIHTLTGNTDEMWRVAFSRDGSKLASTSFDKTIKVWNAQTGALIHTLRGDFDVNGVAFSRDGSILASTRYNTIQVGNAQTGALIHTLTGFTGSVQGIAFSGDGSILAGSSVDYTIKVWDLRSDSVLHHAIRGCNFNVVKRLVKRFPLFPYIRTPEGQSPLELAKTLVGDNDSGDAKKIVDLLRELTAGSAL